MIILLILNFKQKHRKMIMRRLSTQAERRFYRTSVHDPAKAKSLKSHKKPKSLSLLPPPWLNYLDPNQTEFLSYASQIPSLRADPSTQVVSVNHLSIEQKLEEDL